METALPSSRSGAGGRTAHAADGVLSNRGQDALSLISRAVPLTQSDRAIEWRTRLESQPKLKLVGANQFSGVFEAKLLIEVTGLRIRLQMTGYQDLRVVGSPDALDQ